MAVSATTAALGVNDAAATSYATASFTPGANVLMLAWVWSLRAAGSPNTPTASGDGVNWVQAATIQHPLADRRMTLFRGMVPAPSTGAVTFDFAAQSQDRACWAIIQFGNVDTSGADGSGAVVQSITGSSSTSTALALTLAALTDPNNATAGGTALGAVLVTPGSGYTELSQNAGAAQDIETEWKQTGATTVDWSYASAVNPVGIGVEIGVERPYGKVLIAPSGAVHRGAGW